MSLFATSVSEFELVAIGIPFAKICTPEILQNGSRGPDRDPAGLSPHRRLVELVTILGLRSAYNTNARLCIHYEICSMMCNGQRIGLPLPCK